MGEGRGECGDKRARTWTLTVALVLLLLIAGVGVALAFALRAGKGKAGAAPAAGSWKGGLLSVGVPRAPAASRASSVLALHQLPFPLRWIIAWPAGRRVGVALNGPFRGPEPERIVLQAKAEGTLLLGFTHYQSFPSKIDNPYEDTYHEKHFFDYIHSVVAWGTCFRDPHSVIPATVPQIDMAESDFADLRFLAAMRSEKKNFDYLYVCLPDARRCGEGWQSKCRNWAFARPCIEALSAAGLRGALVGREKCLPQLSQRARGAVVATSFLKYPHFIRMLASARVLFVPNVLDASPRVVTEALGLGVAVLVNRRILGGWKYVREKGEGLFFDEEDGPAGVVAKMKALVTASRRGMVDTSSFTSEFGRERSAKRLAAFLASIGKKVEGTEKVCIKV